MELLWRESNNDTIMSPGKGRGRDITSNSKPVFKSEKMPRTTSIFSDHNKIHLFKSLH